MARSLLLYLQIASNGVPLIFILAISILLATKITFKKLGTCVLVTWVLLLICYLLYLLAWVKFYKDYKVEEENDLQLMNALLDCKINIISLIFIALGDDLLRLNFIYLVYELVFVVNMVTCENINEFKKKTRKTFIEKISLFIIRILISIAVVVLEIECYVLESNLRFESAIAITCIVL